VAGRRRAAGRCRWLERRKLVPEIVVHHSWSVLVSYEGPKAEIHARQLLTESMKHGAVGLVAGGPGFPNWDVNDVPLGWETHTYQRAIGDVTGA
jgi:hypothetical protein